MLWLAHLLLWKRLLFEEQYQQSLFCIAEWFLLILTNIKQRLLAQHTVSVITCHSSIAVWHWPFLLIYKGFLKCSLDGWVLSQIGLLYSLVTCIIIEYCWNTVGNEIKQYHSSLLEFLHNYITFELNFNTGARSTCIYKKYNHHEKLSVCSQLIMKLDYVLIVYTAWLVLTTL